jgi:hypothetical protein
MLATLPGAPAPTGGLALPAAEPLPRGLPPLPWKPLTAAQRKYVMDLLETYLRHCYLQQLAFTAPQFVMQTARYPLGSEPEGYEGQDVARHGKGNVNDPTLQAVQTLIDGPRLVEIETRYVVQLPYIAVRMALLALATHQREAIRQAYILRKNYVGSEEVLHMSYRTIGRHCIDGLASMCRAFYGDRWDATP